MHDDFAGFAMAQNNKSGALIANSEFPISSITIKSFRGIRDLRLDFGHVNVLYGRAGTGKSSVLEAILMLGTGMGVDALGIGITSQIPRKFISATEDPRYLINVSSDESHLSGKIADSYVELLLSKDREKVFNGLDNEVPITSIRVSLSNLLPESSSLRYIVYKLTLDGKTARIGALAQGAIPMPAGMPLGQPDSVTANIMPYHGPEQFESKALLLREPGERLFEAFSKVIRENKKEELLQRLAGILDERILDANAIGNRVLLNIESLPRPIEAQSTAAGYVGAFEMVSSLVCLEQGKALLIEEPEAHLNPLLFSRLIRVIVNGALEKNVQLFVVTHNPEIATNIVDHYTKAERSKGKGKKLVSIWMYREKGEIRADTHEGEDAKLAIKGAAGYDFLN
ncbi:AAA family ATPase [Tardisphaera miroshnichenkoae]